MSQAQSPKLNLETKLFGWTVQGLDMGRAEANEGLIQLLGDGFTWHRVPLETWVANIEFMRQPERTPSRMMTQVIKYNAANEEIGRTNAPTSMMGLHLSLFNLTAKS